MLSYIVSYHSCTIISKTYVSTTLLESTENRLPSALLYLNNTNVMYILFHVEWWSVDCLKWQQDNYMDHMIWYRVVSCRVVSYSTVCTLLFLVYRVVCTLLFLVYEYVLYYSSYVLPFHAISEPPCSTVLDLFVVRNGLVPQASDRCATGDHGKETSQKWGIRDM